MQLTLTIHPEWFKAATAPELASLLADLHLLEFAPPRVAGGDDDDRSERQFAEGLDDEPTAPPSIAVRTFSQPPGSNVPPASARFSEPPKTNGNGHANGNGQNGHAKSHTVGDKPGKRFWAFLKDEGDDTLRRATSFGRRKGFPSQVTLWSAGMIQEAVRELERLSAASNGNGRSNGHTSDYNRRN
jgi:hypothetical protein